MTRSPKRLVLATAAVALFALLAVACRQPGTTSPGDQTVDTIRTPGTLPEWNQEAPVAGGTLVYGLSAETNGWDPSTSQWSPSGLTVARTIFDTLTVFDENGEIQPYLAESFEPNEDFTVWDINLRPGIKFHNGEDLNAAAVKKNFEFFIESPLTGPIFERFESVEVVDDLTVRVTLNEIWANFPKAFTTQIGVVAAPAMLDAPSAERAQNPIGTGPFKFDEWQPDNKLTVVKNPGYWQEGLPYLDKIEFRPITDVTSRAASLQAGDIDVAMLESPGQLDQFRDNDRFVIWTDPDAETAEAFIMLNTLQPPLDDLRVRQALAYGTNREAIIQVTADGEREEATGPFRRSSPWYVETDYPDYDPDKARALVDEVEAENGPIEFELRVGAGVDAAKLAQLVQEQWGAVGIDVNIESGELATLIVDVVFGDYEAMTWRQFDSPHPLQETVWWHSDGATDLGEYGLNFARNRNETLTDALDKARTVTTKEEEIEQYAIVQRELAKDLPYIWISHDEMTHVAGSDVVNLYQYTIPDTDLRATSLSNSAHALQQVWLRQ